MEATTFVEVQQLYARQSHLIDSGRAEEWARTFTEDGEFHSPSYPGPVIGRQALRAFAERFTKDARDAGEVRRHVITNVFAEPGSSGELQVSAYLQVIATAVTGLTRTLRFTTVHDRLRRDGDTWYTARREVHRDDLPARERP
ncbi:nuclear transport factor 2 family protein [Nocardiopsis nanhaiensis]